MTCACAKRCGQTFKATILHSRSKLQIFVPTLVLPECDKETVAIVPQPEPMFHSNAREADQLVWCHAAMWKPQTFLIYSPDTDIYNIGLTIPLQISIINNKMAALSSDVPALKSAFHALNECGLPLSVCIHLQMCGLHLKNALCRQQLVFQSISSGLLGCLLITKEIIIKGGENHVKRRSLPPPTCLMTVWVLMACLESLFLTLKRLVSPNLVSLHHTIFVTFM